MDYDLRYKSIREIEANIKAMQWRSYVDASKSFKNMTALPAQKAKEQENLINISKEVNEKYKNRKIKTK
jgi:hypothetical protein